MEYGTGVSGPSFYTLIPLEDFKAILGIDDREDKLSRFCLIAASFAIEQHCKRRLLRKKHTDYLTFTGEGAFPLPLVEFGEYSGGGAVVPVVGLAACERTEKKRVIRMDAYAVTITFAIPESLAMGGDGERCCYAYAAAVDVEAKLVSVIWFSDSGEVQEAVFPTAALSRLEEQEAPVKADKPAGAKRGRLKP
jgi:hypothetical protein